MTSVPRRFSPSPRVVSFFPTPICSTPTSSCPHPRNSAPQHFALMINFVLYILLTYQNNWVPSPWKVQVMAGSGRWLLISIFLV
ncbi:hypothetical protein L207DRAFT_334963 [Hyaloscypha variabilis F]|uniref:Uncharacterized protein n=1 Tax=Hyaloscypha variabilis (strain UAMH 11265 / GT02V1 / F) TaxID=1149755 RepID=A0A2J6RNV1_HYAVF|nr:hypothetical protein L207DRAFT_334963 [Hyaloscypha variabilis F]